MWYNWRGLYFLVTWTILAAPLLAQDQPKEPGKASGGQEKSTQATQPSQDSNSLQSTETPEASPSPPAADAEPERTPAELFLEQCAEKVEAIPYVAAKLMLELRLIDRVVVSEGTYRLAAANEKVRLELDVDMGTASGHRLYISDGKIGYRHERVLDAEQIFSYRMDEIRDLLAKSQIPPEQHNEVLKSLNLPMLLPGTMLRGYLAQFTFPTMEPGTFEGRPVQVIEGEWNAAALRILLGREGASIADLPAGTPKYLRLQMDQESGWPVSIELFRRDETAEYKPALRMVFTELHLGQPIPDEEFVYLPPPEIDTTDRTQEILVMITQLSDLHASRRAAEASSEQSASPAPAAE